jgi:hypothetical protein
LRDGFYGGKSLGTIYKSKSINPGEKLCDNELLGVDVKFKSCRILPQGEIKLIVAVGPLPGDMGFAGMASRLLH